MRFTQIFLAFAACNSLCSAATELRGWTLADSIATPYLADSSANLPWLHPEQYNVDNIVSWSPDHTAFYFVRQWGDQSQNETVVELNVFTVAKVAAALDIGESAITPLRRIQYRDKIVGETHAGPIQKIRWDRDSRGLSFIAKRNGGAHGTEIHYLDLASGEVRRQVALADGIKWFTSSGGTLAFSAPSPNSQPRPLTEGGSMWALEPSANGAGQFSRGWFRVRLGDEVLLVRGDAKPIKVQARVAFSPALGGPNVEISPSGKFAVAAVLAQEGPEWRSTAEHAKALLAPQSFLLIDCETVASSKMRFADGQAITSRPDEFTKLLWHPDDEAVYFLSLKKGRVVVTEYNISSGRAREETTEGKDFSAYPSRISSASWQMPGKALKIRINTRKPNEERGRITEWIVKKNPEGGWAISEHVGGGAATQRTEDRLNATFKLFISESATSPGTIGARRDSKEVLLAPTHPDFLEHVQIETGASLSWSETISGQVNGKLYVPRNNVGPLPLIVQVQHNVSRNLFRPDGSSSSLYATQALLAKGYAVLEVPAIMDVRQSGPEGPRICRRIEAAIDAAKAQYEIDLERIALLGFSRCGYQVLYAITHPGRYKFVSAVCSDSFTGTVCTYLQELAFDDGFGNQFEAMTGGNLWEKTSAWLEHDPTLNIPHLRTPLIYFSFRADDLWLSQGYIQKDITDLLGSLSFCKKPFDFVILPTAGHVLYLPEHRVAVMQTMIEWVDFWARGTQPPDPVRAARWAILRKQQNEVLKTPPPPKGKWQFVPDPVQPEWHPPGEGKPGTGVEP